MAKMTRLATTPWTETLAFLAAADRWLG